MAHARVAASGETADVNGCIATTYVPEGVIADAEYDTWYDAGGFALPGKGLVSVSEQGASVVVDIDP